MRPEDVDYAALHAFACRSAASALAHFDIQSWREHISHLEKSAPAPIFQRRFQAHMDRLQMRAKHVIDILGRMPAAARRSSSGC